MHFAPSRILRDTARTLLLATLCCSPTSALAAKDLAPRGPLPPAGFLKSCLELIQQQRYEEARARLVPVVSDHPGWARAHFYLGLTYHKQHRYDLSRELFERTLALEPDYHTARPFLGWALYYLGELERSRQTFASYLEVEPDYPDALFALGLIDFDRDDLAAARARFLRVIELARASQDRSTEAKSRARLADVQVRSGALDQAKQELERSIELNPDNYETYFKLSRVLERLGDAERAQWARRMHDEIRARKHSAPDAEEP